MSDRTLRLLAGLDLPFLIVSRKIGEERALELMHAGAHDYVSRTPSTASTSIVVVSGSSSRTSSCRG